MAAFQLRKDQNHEEANKLYVTIEPLKKEILEAYSSVRTGRYQHAILLLKNIIEVRNLSLFLMFLVSRYAQLM